MSFRPPDFLTSAKFRLWLVKYNKNAIFFNFHYTSLDCVLHVHQISAKFWGKFFCQPRIFFFYSTSAIFISEVYPIKFFSSLFPFELKLDFFSLQTVVKHILMITPSQFIVFASFSWQVSLRNHFLRDQCLVIIHVSFTLSHTYCAEEMGEIVIRSVFGYTWLRHAPNRGTTTSRTY